MDTKYHSEEERKAAKKIYAKRYLEKNRETKRQSTRKWRAKRKNKYDLIKSRAGCLFCGESDSRCLDFHHKDKKVKKAEVSVLIRNASADAVIMEEIAKCVVLCANCHRKLHTSDYQEVVFKGWGYELWIVNNDKYCGKVLGVKVGKKCSWHYHKIKDETFYINKGKILLHYGWDEDINKAETTILAAGASFHVPIGLIHRFEALVDSEIIEFSTQHFDSDSHRVTPGD